jgi:hypothetical protein
MFLIREYAGCVLMVLMLAAPLATLLFLAFGIGHLVKAGRTRFVRGRFVRARR